MNDNEFLELGERVKSGTATVVETFLHEMEKTRRATVSPLLKSKGGSTPRGEQYPLHGGIPYAMHSEKQTHRRTV